ncbi:MAG: response regulator [Prosthecobacter sp.]
MTRSKSTARSRLLILDDDPIISGFYKEVLEEQGYEVELVHRVSLLLNRIQKDQAWDALVLDFMMPHADLPDLDYGQTDDGLLTGVFVVQKIKDLLSGVPIMILTNRRLADVLGYLKNLISPEDIKSKFEFPPEEFARFLRQRL